METIDSIYTVLITLVTVLGSAGAWRYYEKKLDKKKNDEFEYRYDCRSRIDKLELLLTQADRDKDEMRKTILELSTQLSALRVKIELLEKRKRPE
jgi:hypothetical protein